MSNVAIYARVSSEIQEKEATIESQVAQLHETAKKQGDTAVGEYRDDGYSGDLLVRPGLDRLRDDAAKKVFDKVLVLSPDRLARKWVYGEVIADELRKRGIAIQYLNQKDDWTEESKLLLGITGLFGQYEKAKIIERTRRGRLHSARSGRVVLSKPPYGYTYLRKTPNKAGHLEINEDQAKVVRLIFDLYGPQGKGASEVGAELYQRGIRSPTGNPAWERSMIMKILKSTTYVGIWHYNKTVAAQPRTIRKPNAIRRRVNTTEHVRPKDQWVAVPGIPPIVDQHIFDTAQAQLERNRRFSKRNRKRDYLLVGLTRCGVCGRSVAGSPNNGYVYYRCTGSFRFGALPARCVSKAVPVPKLEAAVWYMLCDLFKNPEAIIRKTQEIREKLAADDHAVMEGRREIENELAQVKAAEDRLLEACSAGAIELEQLRRQMDKCKEKRDTLKLRLDSLTRGEAVQPIDFGSVETYCRKVARGLRHLESNFTERQKFVRSILDTVVVSGDKATLTGALPAASELQEPHRSLDVGPLPSHTRRIGRCRSHR